MSVKTNGKKTKKAKAPSVSINIQVENISITKTTITNDKGQHTANFFTGGNVTLTRAQQLVIELITEQAKRQAVAQIEQKTKVEGGKDDGTSKGPTG